MRSSAEAVAYAQALHALVVWLGICDGNMQEGSFRCDANVSVRRPGAPFGTRREIKNLNSFRFMQQAIDYEVQWQIDLIEDGGSGPAGDRAVRRRARRDAGDAQQGRRARLPLLPRPRPAAAGRSAPTGSSACAPRCPSCRATMAARFERDYALGAYDAAMMTQSRGVAAYFETRPPRASRRAASWSPTG